MNIQIGKYRIKREPLNLVVYEMRVKKKRGKTKPEDVDKEEDGKEREFLVGYYTCLKEAMLSILRRTIDICAAETAQEIIDAIEKAEAHIVDTIEKLEEKQCQ